jgi:hypothetical protein
VLGASYLGDSQYVGAYENFLRAGEAMLTKRGNGTLAGVAFHIGGMLAASFLTKEEFNGKSRQEWFANAYYALNQGATLLYQGKRALAWPSMLGLLYMITSYAQLVDTGVIVDPNFTGEFLLNEQIRIADWASLIGAMTGNKFWVGNFYRGIAKSRLAWNKNDQVLAYQAITELLEGMRDADLWMKEYSGASNYRNHLAFAYHYLGRAYTIFGTQQHLALAALEEAETNAKNITSTVGLPYPMAYSGKTRRSSMKTTG